MVCGRTLTLRTVCNLPRHHPRALCKEGVEAGASKRLVTSRAMRWWPDEKWLENRYFAVTFHRITRTRDLFFARASYRQYHVQRSQLTMLMSARRFPAGLLVCRTHQSHPHRQLDELPGAGGVATVVAAAPWRRVGKHSDERKHGQYYR